MFTFLTSLYRRAGTEKTRRFIDILKFDPQYREYFHRVDRQIKAGEHEPWVRKALLDEAEDLSLNPPDNLKQDLDFRDHIFKTSGGQSKGITREELQYFKNTPVPKPIIPPMYTPTYTPTSLTNKLNKIPSNLDVLQRQARLSGDRSVIDAIARQKRKNLKVIKGGKKARGGLVSLVED